MTLPTLSEIFAPATITFGSPSSKFLGLGPDIASDTALATLGISSLILPTFEATPFTFSVISWTFSATSATLPVTLFTISVASGVSCFFDGTSLFSGFG